MAGGEGIGMAVPFVFTLFVGRPAHIFLPGKMEKSSAGPSCFGIEGVTPRLAVTRLGVMFQRPIADRE